MNLNSNSNQVELQNVTANNTSPKYTSFSINSILVKNDEKTPTTSQTYYNNQSMPSFQNNFYQQNASLPNNIFSSSYPNQMQLFYNYLNHMNQKQLFFSNLNFNFNNNSNLFASNLCDVLKDNS